MRQSTGPSVPLPALRLLLLLAALHVCGSSPAVAGSADDLASGLALFDRGKKDEALSLFRKASEDPRIAPWALLAEAEVLRSRDRFDDAAALAGKIPEGAAAYPDAQLLIADLELSKKLSRPQSTHRAAALARIAEVRGRGDLRNPLQFMKAREALASGRNAEARDVLQQIRKDAPRTDLARRARELLKSFTPAVKRTPDAVIDEAKQLIREDEAVRALELLRASKAETKPGTMQYFRLLETEASALRAGGRSSEADKIYEQLAREAPVGIGDDALLLITRNAWNKNDNARALATIELLRSKFPGSRLRDAAEQIEARIYDEEGKTDRAVALYKSIGERAESDQLRCEAIRARGWIDLRERRLEDAAESFLAGAAASEKAIKTLIRSTGPGGKKTVNPRAASRELRDMLYERAHALYWAAAAISHLERAGKKRPGWPTAERLLAMLRSEQPRSYYTMLARLKTAVPAEPPPARMERCEIEVDAAHESLLRELFRAGLRSYAEHEIGLHFSTRYPDLQRRVNDPANEGPYDRAEIDYLLTRARLQIDFGSPLKGVSLADSLLTKPRAIDAFAFDPAPCIPRMEELAYPLNHLANFRAASEETGVPVTLLLAISRTESYFDPRARSPKDARGLMQLLPSTAREEGLKPGQDLYEPAVNITLGARHLARLRRLLNGEDQLAIAAYNAGRPAVYRWRERHPELDLTAWTEMIAYQETRNYVKKVLLAKSVYDKRLKND